MARTTRHHALPRTTPRHLWLAALGVAAVARREAATAAAIAREELPRLRDDALRFAGDARDVARGIALTAQERLGSGVERIAGEAQVRLSPVLARIGLRLPATRARRAPAKRTTRRAAAGRKQAESRVARKGR